MNSNANKSPRPLDEYTQIAELLKEQLKIINEKAEIVNERNLLLQSKDDIYYFRKDLEDLEHEDQERFKIIFADSLRRQEFEIADKNFVCLLAAALSEMIDKKIIKIENLLLENPIFRQ